MKKVINLLGAILITGCVSAQWTYKTMDNGFDEPYKIAYTAENNGAFLKMEYVDSFTVLYIQGGFYCDEEPPVDLVFTVNGVEKKHMLIGDKSEDNTTVFLTWSFELWPEVLEDFKAASNVKIRVRESYCNNDIYSFKMTNSKAAYQFMIK